MLNDLRRGFPSQNRGAKILTALVTNTLRADRAIRFLPCLLGWATGAPPPVEFGNRQQICPLIPCFLRDCPKREQVGEARNQHPDANFHNSVEDVSNNEQTGAQGVMRRLSTFSAASLPYSIRVMLKFHSPTFALPLTNTNLALGLTRQGHAPRHRIFNVLNATTANSTHRM